MAGPIAIDRSWLDSSFNFSMTYRPFKMDFLFLGREKGGGIFRDIFPSLRQLLRLIRLLMHGINFSSFSLQFFLCANDESWHEVRESDYNVFHNFFSQ